MEALCSHVASRGDKFCTAAANSGQAVVAVDSWRAQRAESSPAMSLNKHHNSFFCPRAGPSGISLNANMKMMSAHGDLMNLKAQRGTHTHTHTRPSVSVPPAHPCKLVLSQSSTTFRLLPDTLVESKNASESL